MSLHTLVQGSLAGRLNLRRAISMARPPTSAVVVNLPGSMRLLETGLAAAAIATALLIGLGS